MSSVTLSEKNEEKRRMNRTLTQKYDMHALRALQKVEAEFLTKLAELCGCEEEDVPIDVDLLSLYNSEDKDFRSFLENTLKPIENTDGAADLIEWVLSEFTRIEEMPTK
eukprot:gene11821-15819_t